MNTEHGSVNFFYRKVTKQQQPSFYLIEGGAIWEKITGSCATTHSVIWQKETLPCWKRSTTD